MATNIASKNLKARPKAAADRISEDIHRSAVIIKGEVLDNTVKHLAEPESVADLTDHVSVPLEFWLEYKTAILDTNKKVSVQIAADQSPKELADDLNLIESVVLPFETSVDGRSYSHAYALRTQLNYAGEIRATGDVKHDNLGFLQRVGFDAFEMAEGQNLEACLSAFEDFSDVYQPSSDDGRLIFARRRVTH